MRTHIVGHVLIKVMCLVGYVINEFHLKTENRCSNYSVKERGH